MNDNQQNPYTKNYMVDFCDAIDLINQHETTLQVESVTLEKSQGRILAEDIFSPETIPPFDNSAMDGYAVNASDLQNASEASPITLELIGLTAAGDPPASPQITKGSAWKIMTGAAVPNGYDSIIPVENTRLKENLVSCFSKPVCGAHIRSSGEDFIEGQKVLANNTLINPNRIMALSSLGIASPLVYKQPEIAVFSTGKELVDDPNQALKAGQIRNSNMPYILAYLKNLPVNAFNAGTNYDDVESYQTALQQELDKGTDIIISTGAVSMGDFDFIPQTIIKMGGEIIFHKAKIRPGKPILFARFPNGTFYFGLPGNPISATIGLRFFVTHLIRRMHRFETEKPQSVKLSNDVSKKKGFRSILKANKEVNQNAEQVAMVLKGQESFKIHPLLDANGWLVLDENVQTASQGSVVSFYPSLPEFN
jgi:molybdopterin molybdotransferase